MQLMAMDRLGPRETAPGIVQFGLLLPWVAASDGNRISVKIIHETDQFLQDVPPLEFALAHSLDPVYGDFWSAEIGIDARDRPRPQSAWGQPGTYVYRFQLRTPLLRDPLDWIIDPFAREFGTGNLSAFTLGYQPYSWSAAEAAWKTPPLSEMVMYELMLNEFGGGIPGSIEKLSYLADLGVNCIEVMPVSNVGMIVDWGFLPVGYFGVDERFGNRRDFQHFVDAAHSNGIAVVLDSVYGHTSENFPYQYVYSRLGYRENPFMGPFAKDYFGSSTDFNRGLTRDFFSTVNHHWLDVYHIDGFRYDCVPNYWDGPLGNGYANLTAATYALVKASGENGPWSRFFRDGKINLMQCAEQLEDPVGVLYQSYSNCTWQNETLGTASAVAHGDWGRLADLGFRQGLSGYPKQTDFNNDLVPKTALQYIENHDHSRFLCEFGIVRGDNELLSYADRSQWYRVQPYLIGLFTSCGIPMLWQGQEFGSDNFVPESGMGRVAMFRPVRWDLFYDEIGRSIVGLVRKLARLRRQSPQFQSGDHYFFNDQGLYQSRGVILFTRSLAGRLSLVALNFGGADQQVPFWFEQPGFYREELHGGDNFSASRGEQRWLTVPGNYGRVWTTA
jgi:maltooligosyltrehalose trehalohydrolase